MKNILIIVTFAVLVLLITGAGYTALRPQPPTPTPMLTPMDVPSPVATIQSSLRAGGSSYMDSNNAYSFLYPNDYVLTEENGGTHIRIHKTGATQQGQTEMYDGIIMVFETISLEGKTLEGWVDTHIATTTADGTLTVITPKTLTTLNGHPGFMYKTRGLGEAEHLIIQRDLKSDNALVISMLVADPQGKNYQEEVDAVLSTIELLK
jgi:hypothetical protein